MASGGVAFSTEVKLDASTLTNIFGIQLSYLGEKLSWDIKPRFDTRNAGDIATISNEKFFAIMNSKVCDEILFNGNEEIAKYILEEVSSSGTAIFYCVYDSGGSYGFALFKNKGFIRRRVTISAERHAEVGTVIELEKKWRRANLNQQEKINFAYKDGESEVFLRNIETNEVVSEYQVNARILDDLMKTQFGWSLWDDDDLSQDYKYYRAT